MENEQSPHHREDAAATRLRQEIASKQPDPGDEAEIELWSGGFSPKAMIGTWLGMGIVSVGLLVLPFFIEQLSFPAAILMILAVWAFGGLRYAWRRLGVHYQLTTQRFIHQMGVVTRRTDRIEVIDIDDVSFTQGPVQRMFGVGTIVLTGSDRTHPTLSMIGIADVKEVAGLIDDTRRKERRKRSLHIESI
jgi:membrane protein YdbS with pleckstrin-like domain